MTNGDAIALNLIPCETNPDNGLLSRTPEPFHAKAEVTVGSRKDNLRHVCVDCRKRHHVHMKARPGVLWG